MISPTVNGSFVQSRSRRHCLFHCRWNADETRSHSSFESDAYRSLNEANWDSLRNKGFCTRADGAVSLYTYVTPKRPLYENYRLGNFCTPYMSWHTTKLTSNPNTSSNSTEGGEDPKIEKGFQVFCFSICFSKISLADRMLPHDECLTSLLHHGASVMSTDGV